MTHTVYFTAAEGDSGTQAAASALLSALQKSFAKVGVFRAFCDGPIESDTGFLNLLAQAGAADDASTAFGATRADYVRSESHAMARMLTRYRDYAIGFDAVLVLGMLDGDIVSPGQLSLNGRAAAHLSAPTILAVSGKDRTVEEVMTVAHMAGHELWREHTPVRAAIVTDAPEGFDQALPGDAIHTAVVALADGALNPEAAAHLRDAVVKGSKVITPIAFTQDLMAKASSRRKRIVLPESHDDRILKAAARVLELSVADIILLGERSEIVGHAAKLGADVSGATFVSLEDADRLEKYATEFARLREKKGVTLEQAREQVKDESYFAVMMVHMGDADGMVSGAVHTTADTLRPAFQIIKTKPGTSIVSSCFLLLLEDRIWVAGDCAVNPNPTPEQLADIASATADTAAQFGCDPKVALLSYSTGSSGKGPDVEAVVEATKLAKDKRPDLAIDGPLQFDSAVDRAVASTKAPDSPVAGQANTFIFPSLEAGNIGYKAIQRSAGAIAVGPILQGINKPVNDLSRGALVEDIVNTIAITAVQAQHA